MREKILNNEKKNQKILVTAHNNGHRQSRYAPGLTCHQNSCTHSTYEIVMQSVNGWVIFSDKKVGRDKNCPP